MGKAAVCKGGGEGLGGGSDFAQASKLLGFIATPPPRRVRGGLLCNVGIRRSLWSRGPPGANECTPRGGAMLWRLGDEPFESRSESLGKVPPEPLLLLCGGFLLRLRFTEEFFVVLWIFLETLLHGPEAVDAVRALVFLLRIQETSIRGNEI
jgi:hypothetical protein